MIHEQIPVQALQRSEQQSFAPLIAALDSEVRLLDELARTLQRQREGVAADDVQLVDESVYGAWRVMRTLQELRRQRAMLSDRLLGTAASPRDWEAVLGSSQPPDVRDARDRLLTAASVVAREIEVNRRVLQQALRTGDDAVRTLLGVPTAAAPVYSASSAAPAAPASSTLINRQV